MTDKITVRDYMPEDQNFILSTWLRSYRHSEMVRHMEDSEYFKTYEPLIKNLMGYSQPLIASLTTDPDVIIGYLCRQYQADANCIHYAYTKDSWRHLGVFNMLLKQADFVGPVYFSHWTNPVFSLIVKYPKFIFNPFRLHNNGFNKTA